MEPNPLKHAKQHLSWWRKLLKPFNGMSQPTARYGVVAAGNESPQFQSGLNFVVPSELLDEILEQCDFLTQMRVERVSHRWKHVVRKRTYNYVILDFHVRYLRRDPMVLERLADKFSDKRARDVKALVVIGNKCWGPLEFDDPSEDGMIAKKAVAYPLFTIVTQLMESDKCPNLKTLIVSDICVRITRVYSRPEMPKLYRVKKLIHHSTTQPVEITNISFQLKFFDHPLDHKNRKYPLFPTVHELVHYAAMEANLDRAKQRFNQVLTDLRNQAILGKADAESTVNVKQRVWFRSSDLWTPASSVQSTLGRVIDVCGHYAYGTPYDGWYTIEDMRNLPPFRLFFIYPRAAEKSDP